MTAPFTNQHEPAVCARVALALLRRYRKKKPYSALSPSILIGTVVGDLAPLKLRTITSAFLSLNHYLLDGHTSASWLSAVEYRDLIGLDIRSCYFTAYKAHRRLPLC